jgi:hypothetical protein
MPGEDRQFRRLRAAHTRLIHPQRRHCPPQRDLQSLDNPPRDLNRRPLNRRGQTQPIGAEGRRQKSYRDQMPVSSHTIS